MLHDLSIDELIIDDSFANYCYQANEQDVLYWENYNRLHPSQKQQISQAKKIVLGLRFMLQSEQEPVALTQIDKQNPLIINKIVRYVAAAAAILIIVFAGKIMLDNNVVKPNTLNQFSANSTADKILYYKTARGEKKVIILNDSSKLYLNAGSELWIDKDFNKNNRTVYLVGEALFDVTHNKALPFIVHSDKFDVKVLGTLFNVKAYPGDPLSETSLIRGKVELTLKNDTKIITLFPTQKAVVDNSGKSLVEGNKQVYRHLNETVALLPISYNSKDSMVIETSWAQNRLEIVDETFTEIKTKLERWYNVKITFKDEAVSKYTFSATFEKETIKQVLASLQNAYDFKYEIKDKSIIISK